MSVFGKPELVNKSREQNAVPKATATFGSYILTALLGVSVGLNILLALRVYRPQLWSEIRLAMIRTPLPRPDDHVLGANGAKVTVIEYSDFQCSFCAQLHPSLRRLADQGKIRWIYRNFPLSSIHPRAVEAAEAAECAGEQGKFWDYADALFELQQDLQTAETTRAFLNTLGTRVGVDVQRFRECVSAQRFGGRIRLQTAEARSMRIDATPTMIVNGKRHVGSLSLEQLEQLFEPQGK
jgi:protein-disulfide isomerase